VLRLAYNILICFIPKYYTLVGKKYFLFLIKMGFRQNPVPDAAKLPIKVESEMFNIKKIKIVWIHLGNDNVHKYYSMTYYNIILGVFSYIFYASVNHVFYSGGGETSIITPLV